MTIASFLETVETDVLNYAEAEIAKGEAWVKSFTPVAEADLQAAWTSYKPQILGAIAAVEQIGLTILLPGSTVAFDKLGAAVAAAGATLAAQGVTVAKTVLSTLIQQAVNGLGNSNAPVATK